MTQKKHPQAVRELMRWPQWVCWQATLDERTGKTKKPPFNPKTGRAAKVNDPATWADFAQAVKGYHRYSFNGMGFMFYPQGGLSLVGIDIDNCIDGEDISELAMDVIEAVGGYWELSPSGSGLHGLVLGRLPSSGRKNPDMSVEVYQNQRYFTITAKHLSWTSPRLEYRQDGINQLWKMVFDSSLNVSPPQPQKNRPPPTDANILKKATNAKNGQKFTALWNGNVQGYDSPSEADYALCSMLAYWSNKNPDAIDRLFQQSALYRKEKWDRVHGADGHTYGQITVNNAIAHCKPYPSR